jgi:chromate transporter
MERKTKLIKLGKLFSKLGITSFGGPAVHIAMMHEEVVRKKQWMTEQHY